MILYRIKQHSHLLASEFLSRAGMEGMSRQTCGFIFRNGGPGKPRQ